VKFFTTGRLRAHGKSPGQIRTMIRNGVLVPIGRGIYVPGSVARQFAAVPHGEHVLRVAATLLRNGRDCAASHQSAALLHNIALIADRVAEVTITTWKGGRHGHRHGVHTYATAMPDAHLTRKFGLPVTTAARTVLDLATSLTFAEGVVAADSALHQELTTAAELWHVAGEGRRRRGGDRANRVAAFANRLAESPLESLARVTFDEGGLPPPELQVPITSAEKQFIGRVDFLWPHYKVVVEVDGAAKYDLDPQRARTELWRDKALRRAGYEVIHFSWAEITTQREQVIAAIWAALRARGAAYPAA
jgi:predicted transcriptional regulator of viral defense system